VPAPHPCGETLDDLVRLSRDASGFVAGVPEKQRLALGVVDQVAAPSRTTATDAVFEDVAS
jgi:hypothetical protein